MTGQAEADAEADPSGPPRHDVPRGGHSAFTVVGDFQVHYLWWGRRDAPPLVCLHGGGQTAYMFEDMGAALASERFVLAPDLPGHGDSDIDPAVSSSVGGLDRRRLAADVVRLLDHVGVDRAAFVGASLGGITSLTIAAHHPERVAAIALIDIGHRLEDEGVARIIDFMQRHESFASLDDAAVAIAEYLPGRKPQSPARLTRNLRQRADGRWEWKHALGRRLRDANAENPDYRPGDWRGLTEGMDAELGQLTCPVLVLRGAAERRALRRRCAGGGGAHPELEDSDDQCRGTSRRGRQPGVDGLAGALVPGRRRLTVR